MKTFQSLDINQAAKMLQEIILFSNKLPISSEIQNKENTILDILLKLFNVIYYQNVDNTNFHAKASFTVNGKNEEIDVIDRSDILLNKFYHEIKSNQSKDGFNHLIKISNDFLNIDKIYLFHKTNLLDVENTALKKKIEHFVDGDDEVLIDDFINIRLKLVYDSINNFDAKIKNDNHFNQDPKSLDNILNLYLGYLTSFYFNRNQIFQLFNYLKGELNKNHEKIIRRTLIRRLINLNSQFQIEPKSIYLELLEKEDNLFSEEDLELLKLEIEANPTGMEIHNVKFSQGTISKTLVANHQIITIIRFSMPCGSKRKDYGAVQLDSSTRIEYRRIENKFKDPVYKAYKDISIGGMGWNFFSDTFNSESKNSLTIAFVINNFYHPDFELNENGATDLDFSRKEALMGREYYPHKEFIIQKFLDNSELIEEEFEIEKKRININLFSNYIVEYVNTDTRALIYRRLYSITNPDSFEKASEKFLDRLSKLNLSDLYIPVRELIDQTKITSSNTLSNFLQVLINIVLKNIVEKHGNYKYFWKRDSEDNLIPQDEPEMQPFIMSQLRVICDYMGIQLSREVESANGEIDFLCSFTHKNKVLKTCIELKNAHSPKWELGLTKQLPEYLESERCKNGIYLVLWYKGEHFDRPKKFDTSDKLKDHLDRVNPKDFNIEVITIDCNKPIIPSKLK